jgi:hypothetical protein
MWFLMNTAQLMVSNGPPEFAKFIRPFVQQWINKPPIGRSTTEGEHGAFATVHMSSNTRAAALQALGWLVFQLPRKLGTSADNDLLAWISYVTSSNELSLMPLAFHSCVVLAAKSSAEQRGSILAAAKSILLTLRIAARDRVEAIYELARAVNYLGKDLSAEKGALIDWSSSPGRDALQEFLDMLNGSLPALCSSPEATVRAQVAFLLWNLKEWHPLDEKLDEVLKKLLQDTRASVRFAANGGWHLAKKHDQAEEPKDTLPADT